MARRNESGNPSYSRTCVVRGHEVDGRYAVIVQGENHTRVARIRSDGTADAGTEKLFPTSEVTSVKTTHVIPTAQRGTITLPAGLRKTFGIEEGTPLQIIEEDGWFSVRPLDRPRTVTPADLNDLLSRVTPENTHTEISFGDAVGRESL